MNWQQLLAQISSGNIRALARGISLVENEVTGYETLLQMLTETPTATIIGITGPPGAGKSTLVDALIEQLTAEGKKVAVLCVDPSSPFNKGALLGDRIRMSQWYNHPQVFIRSLASRGSLGGLHPKIIEITDVVKSAGFDYIITETVGVGQSEVEIAGLADITVVVLVPEAGDEIQTMKAGLMEIADIFVVNKSDRPGADIFINNLLQMMRAAPGASEPAPIIKASASQKEGIKELWQAVDQKKFTPAVNDKKNWLLAEKAFYLIQQQRMKTIDKTELKTRIEQETGKHTFNLYRFVAAVQ